MDFGQRLLQLLYHHGISQKQLALELKIAPTTLNGYVNNRREPDYKILKELWSWPSFSMFQRIICWETSLPSPLNPPPSQSMRYGCSTITAS